MKSLKANQFLLSSSSPKPTSFFLSKPTPNLRLRTPFAKRFRACRTDQISAPSKMSSSPPSSSFFSLMAAGGVSTWFRRRFWSSETMEEALEKAIYRCRFMTLFGVLGSLVGSVLCFIKGCNVVAASFTEHVVRSGKVMGMLVEAIDVYLLGTVMLVFGMGLYELFVCNINVGESLKGRKFPYRSNLFGLFTLMERPRWLEIKSVNELKTKLGHVIVMLLLIGFFDNSKKAAIHSPTDLLCFSASILLCSGCLYLLAKLNGGSKH